MYNIQSRDEYIYIITHPAFTGWIKVGRTTWPKERLVNYQTGCPDRAYQMVYKLVTTEVRAIESYFRSYIESNGCEWFKCTVDKAIEIIESIAVPITETSPVLEEAQSTKVTSIRFLYIINKDTIVYSFDEVLSITGLPRSRLSFSTFRGCSTSYIDDNFYIKKMKTSMPWCTNNKII